MFRKIIRWFLILLVLGVLLLAGALWAFNGYLDSRKEKILNELIDASGLDVSFQHLEVSAWRTFPRVTLAIDSLVVRDSARPTAETPLLAAMQLSGELSLGNLLHDTLRLNHFSLHDGGIYVASDSAGTFNLGRLVANDEETDTSAREKSFFAPVLQWNGARAELANMDLSYLHPTRNKRMEVHLDTLRAEVNGAARGDLSFTADLRAFVKGIAFNTDKGSFFGQTPLEGQLQMNRRNGDWVLAPTGICLGDQRFFFELNLRSGSDKQLLLTVSNPETNYDPTLAMLPEVLRVRLERHHVEGPFPVSATVLSDLVRGKDPLVKVDFTLSGHDARIRKYLFREAYTSGTFVNHLDPAEGGIVGSKKNFRVTLNDSRAHQGALFLRLPHGIIRGTTADIRLEAPLQISGPATDINQRVGTRDFIFERGKFSLSTKVNASLNSMEKMIQSSDGVLDFRNTRIRYKPAGVRFPLRHLNVDKRGKDIRFRLQSDRLKTGFTFAMNGTLDNLVPLLLERPADSIRADVNFQAPRIDWTDFLAIFGQDGFLAEENERVPSDAEASDGVQAMKTALLGLRSTFRPTLEARFDTVAYYDVLTLENFTTGLHFNKDTLVLERTSFDWEDANIDFGAYLGLGQARKTPFRLNVKAGHLNLNRLRPSLEYFGLKLPRGLDSLPRNLDIDFTHRGVINDTLGIASGVNEGRLSFKEGDIGMFAGSLNYAPGQSGLKSKLHLRGDPRFVNQLFAAEDFFFGTGRFTIDLDIDGTPEDLTELLGNSALHLRIDSSRVAYLPGAFTVPVRSFTVAANEDGVQYDLALFADSTRSAVDIRGTLDRLVAFLYPDSSRSFRVTTDARASSLHWSDIRKFLKDDNEAAADSSSADLRKILSASGGLFSDFRPDLSVTVDTFWTDDNTRLTELYAGLRMKDSTRLVLEKSGFRLGEGNVRVSATYDIDRRYRSPFTAKWRADSLALQDVIEVLDQLEVGLPEQASNLRGVVSTQGNLRSRLNESRQRVMMDSTYGEIDLLVSNLKLDNWPALMEIGRKAWMKKRFRKVFFAPLSLHARIDSGRVTLPRTEIQTSALQLFVEGSIDTLAGTDLLVAIPLRNIWRGVLEAAPAPTGYAAAGCKVYMVVEQREDGKIKTSFRLGRRRYFRERGGMEALRTLRAEERMARRALRKKRKAIRARARVQK